MHLIYNILHVLPLFFTMYILGPYLSWASGAIIIKYMYMCLVLGLHKTSLTEFLIMVMVILMSCRSHNFNATDDLRMYASTQRFPGIFDPLSFFKLCLLFRTGFNRNLKYVIYRTNDLYFLYISRFMDTHISSRMSVSPWSTEVTRLTLRTLMKRKHEINQIKITHDQ